MTTVAAALFGAIIGIALKEILAIGLMEALMQ